MLKRRVSTSVSSGLAILAGALSFTGSAQNVVLVNEGFEGATNLFSAGTYNYSQNYTMPNLLSPAGGLVYMKGGAGVTGQVSENLYPLTVNLVSGGITGSQIDAGSVRYNLYSQFSTYRQQTDFAELRVQFLNAANGTLGTQLTIGGAAFTAALGTGNNGTYTDAHNWGADSLSGLVPPGARSATVTIRAVKEAGGTAIDGYVDNVLVSLNVVPEPGLAALVAMGGGLLLTGRKRRR
jgi:hypothetical protein